MTIRSRQVAGVTALVALVVLAMSAFYVVSIARLRLSETVARGQLLADEIFQAASKVVPEADQPYMAIQTDHGVRSLLESSIAYASDVTSAAIVDNEGTIVAHSFPTLEGQPLPTRESLTALEQAGPWAQFQAIYSTRLFEVRQPLFFGGHEFGSIHVGVSMLLIQEGLRQAFIQGAWSALAALVVASVVATLLAGWILRPIHVISSGLTRLGRGEFDVRLDLPPGDEFRALGSSFAEVSARLSATHVSPSAAADRPGTAESPASYASKLASLGRLLAGVAHEVKNPLNAMTIHIELLRQKLQGVPVNTDLERHLTTIGAEIKRLDQAMAGLVKFVRPEELHLRPVQVGDLVADVVRVIEPEARRASVTVRTDCGRDLPDINADPGMLQQALVNLALNACQAMPTGGTLEFRCRGTGGQRVEVAVRDSGVGISPEHLERIFDLYFTTKDGGSGIGLSLVYRIVQLHDGEIAVESTPGRGTTFRLLLPRT